jgi:SAM-dependent methyltransferase
VNNEEKIERWLGGMNRGIEIGAFDCPLPIIKPVYVDIFEEFAGTKCLVDVLADSTSLPFPPGNLDYVAASHVLEHVANPLKALIEWTRITRHGGILYLVLPDRNHTWERLRPAVSAAHLLEDFTDDVNQSDGTHIDEFVDALVWEEFSPQDPGETAREHYRKILKAAIEHGQDINIHFHAFDPEMFASFVRATNHLFRDGERLEIVDFETRFPENCPNGFLAVLRVLKPASPG